MDTLGFWMKAAGSKPMLSHERIVELAGQMKTLDPESRKYRKCVGEIVEHNLRLVVSFVHKFVLHKTLFSWGGQESLDLLQAGCIGLIRAAEKYDPDSGYKFSTYAVPWISSKVNRAKMKYSSPFDISEEAIRRACYYMKHGKPVTCKTGKNPSEKDTKDLVAMVVAAQAPMPIDAYTHVNGQSYNLSETIPAHYSINEFNDGCFTTQMEDSLLLANLSEEQIVMLRQMFVENRKSKEIQQLMNLSSQELSAMKTDAMKKLKRTLSRL